MNIGGLAKVVRKECISHILVENAEYIITDNEQVKEPHYSNKSEKFFDNPDLSIHRFITKVLEDVGL